MKPKIDYNLYLVTDRDLMSTSTLELAVEEAILGGCGIIQLREKKASSLEFYQTALRVKKITDSYQIPLVINDRVDIALAVDAAGAHVGQSDLPVVVLRRLIGQSKIIGVSVSSLAEALKAEQDGADYLGVGAMLATGTKPDAKIVTIDELRRIRSAVSLQIVAIGGINQQTIPYFANTGIDGIAVISALISAKDIAGTARELKELFLRTKEERNA